MATLTQNITATARDIMVSGDTSAAARRTYYVIDSEVVLLRSFRRPDRDTAADQGRWIVERGALGTEKATHSAGAEIAALADAFVAGVNLTSPAPIVEGGAPSVVFYSEEDPGAVGAGAIWLQPDINTLSSKMHIRNAEDTAWEGLWVSRTDQGEIRLETSDADDDPIGRVVVAPGALSLLGAAASHANVTLSLATTETSLVMLDSSQTRIVGFVMDAQGFHIGGSTEPALRSGAADPSAGAGVAAPQGSAYLRSNGQLWMKTGAGNTAWTQMATVP